MLFFLMSTVIVQLHRTTDTGIFSLEININQPSKQLSTTFSWTKGAQAQSSQ